LFFAQSGWMGASLKLAVVGVREIYPATKRMFSGPSFFAFIGSRPWLILLQLNNNNVDIEAILCTCNATI
jgi:hypothetical protein